MGYGISVINSKGSIQIDQDYPNLVFREKFTVTSLTLGHFSYQVDGGNNVGWTTTDSNTYLIIDYVGTNAVIALTWPDSRDIYPLGGYTEVTSSNVIGPPPGSYQPLASNIIRRCFKVTGSTVFTTTVYIYDQVDFSSVANTGYGMQISSASGNIVYHSNYHPIRGTDLIDLSGTNINTIYNLTSNSAPAVMFSSIEASYLPANDPYMWYIGLRRVSSTQVQVVSYRGYNTGLSHTQLINYSTKALITNIVNL